MPRHAVRCGWLIAAMVVAALDIAQAQADYPNRQITLVVPLPAGGTADILARIAAEQIRVQLGQTVVVENRAGGAGGVIGMESVFKSAPDGYTLICAPQLTYSIMNVLNPKVSFDIGKFEPVSILADYPAILMVRADLPIKTMADLIGHAKANPGKLNYGSQGHGQIGHLAMEQLRQATKIELTHVPFRGSAPAMTALSGGQIDLMFDLLPSSKQLIEAGKVRLIAVASSERLKPFPSIPTVAETLAGFEADTWMGIAAPPGTPKDVIKKISDAIGQAFRTPAVNGRIAAMDIEPRGTTSDEMQTKIRKSAERWTPVIRAGNITVE